MSCSENSIQFGNVLPFRMEIKHAALDASSPYNTSFSHQHNMCEIYINIKGDVSFMVENKLYPIIPGSVIITRPGEFHHCIYHSKKCIHDHVHILFSAAGNEKLLPRFFARKKGTDNLIILPPETAAKAIRLCDSLLIPSRTELDSLSDFFALLSLIDSQTALECELSASSDVQTAISYILTNISEPITVKELAYLTHSSINTFERHFSEELHMSPREYIKQRRLHMSRNLLVNTNKSVQRISEECGFSDCSHFIAIFRKEFGITPLQFRKSAQ